MRLNGRTILGHDPSSNSFKFTNVAKDTSALSKKNLVYINVHIKNEYEKKLKIP